VGDSTLRDNTVSTAYYDSSHTLNDDGSVTGGKLTSNSEVTSNFFEFGASESPKVPSSPTLGSKYFETSEAFVNIRNTTNKSDEKGTYFDFLGFRLSFGTYTEEFSTDSSTYSILNKDSEQWTQGTEEIEKDYTEEKNTTRDTSSHERELKGTYSPLGGTESVEKDHQKSSSIVSTITDESANHFDGYDLWWRYEYSTRTNTDVSLDKASGTQRVRTFITSYVPSTGETIPQLTNGTVVTDLYENTAPPKKSGPRDTGGSGGGVYQFVAGAAGSAAVNVLDPAGVIRGASSVLGTLSLVAHPIQGRRNKSVPDYMARPKDNPLDNGGKLFAAAAPRQAAGLANLRGLAGIAGEIGLAVVVAFVEPVDYALTAREVYNDPTNVYSYLGFLPGIPAGASKIFKAADKGGDFGKAVRKTAKAVGEVVKKTYKGIKNAPNYQKWADWC